MEMPLLFGILNLSQDSFSDGGLYSDPTKALTQAKNLIQEGAYAIDIGAQSSNPDSQPLPWKEEWNSIETVWNLILSLPTNLSRYGKVYISIDSSKPEILEKAWEKGLDFWNDIRALGSPGMAETIQNHRFTPSKDFPYFITMFSHNRGTKAERSSPLTPKRVVQHILEFFFRETDIWISWGIPEDKIIYDPGMGFFLGEDPELSLEVLRNIHIFQEKLGKIFLSVSRKSFLGKILGNKPPLERKYATWACEFYLIQKQIHYIRTHEIKPIRDMMEFWKALNP